MFSQYFHSIEYVTVYPIVSLFFFMIAFAGIVVWALKADDEYIRSMETLPLDASADQRTSE